MKIVVINPPLLSQYSDFFSSGIPYFPIGAAYVSATLHSVGHEVTVIDAFGEKSSQIYWHNDKAFIQGLTFDEIIEKIPRDTKVVCFYASLVTSHHLNLQIVQKLKEKLPKVKAIIFENSQQVYAYSLKEKLDDFFNAGFDYVVTGEPEERIPKLLKQIGKKVITVDAVAYKLKGKIKFNPKKGFIKNLDALPFPAYEMFPLESYWNLGYSHGVFSGKYLPMLTSRGCPYGCRFCVVPATNNRLWRVRSAESVVDELEHWGKTLEVTDFHWEDLNPTVDKRRMSDICDEIEKRGLKITWKLSAGTKIDTFDIPTLENMSRAGCVYVSFSPESGSPQVLQLMNKPFNHEHAVMMVKRMHELKVTSQACFVLGFPGETEENLRETWTYLKLLTKKGLDETSLFIMAPIPGAEKALAVPGYSNETELCTITFSPEFRLDYKKLESFRNWLYFNFFLWKLRYHPVKAIKSVLNVLTRNFKTKTEMTIWKAFKTRIIPKIPFCK